MSVPLINLVPHDVACLVSSGCRLIPASLCLSTGIFFMPKRSNQFQRLIFRVKQQVAGDAEVTESKFLQDHLTGASREVDICIEKSIGGHLVRVCIECRDHKRKADVTWVEAMKAKHERLPTNALVLVSREGFTREAEEVANKYGIETLPFKKIDAASVDRLFGNLSSIWAKGINLKPAKVVIQVSETDWSPAERVSAVPDNIVFTFEGEPLCTVRDLIGSWLKSESVMKEALSRGDESYKGFMVRWDNPSDTHGNPLCLRKEAPFVIRRIEYVEVIGECEFNVNEFPLEHGLLGRIKVSWGVGSFMGEDSFLVASEDEGGKKTTSITRRG